MTPFIGVRISWDILARKSDLARFAFFGGVACLLEARPILLERAKLNAKRSKEDNEAENRADCPDCNECRLPSPIREGGIL
jgi:hypothetical protein